MDGAPAKPASVLAPFAVRSFRFQWPADLATSWSFEMETLILGWYVLVATDSVLLLTLFAALQYVGTLVAPMFGVAGDRKGARAVLSAMRAFYMVQAAVLTGFVYFDALSPFPVFVIGAMMGIVRPSDIAIRYSLVGETIPSKQLVGAMGVSRTTTDSARVAGALAGAGIVATLGMTPAYTAVTLLYAVSALLTLGTARRPRNSDADALAQAAAQAGLAALTGEPGPVRESLVYGAALSLVQLGRCPDAASAAAAVRSVIDDGLAARRLEAAAQ